MSSETLDTKQWHKKQAVDLFNAAWDLIDKKNRTKKDDFTMIHTAHASRYHWEQVGGPLESARGEWQISRVYSILGKGDCALFHGLYSLELCLDNGIVDFDLAFGYEAVARAYKVLGEEAQRQKTKQKALDAAQNIKEKDDKDYTLSEIETI